MFAPKFNADKLKTNLRLCITRLKHLEKKKTEIALKSRKEIADFISASKEDRARIRVEQIIREDYLVEAMELVELFCDLLVARMGLLQSQSELDPGLEEAVATLLWVSPRLVSDVPEMKAISNQLTIKYNKIFAEACCTNSLNNVCDKVMHKMSVQAPPKQLIERYMCEIARSFGVPFEPDPCLIEDDLGEPPTPPDCGDSRGGGGGGYYPGNLIDWNPAQPPPVYADTSEYSPGGSTCGVGGGNETSGGCGGGNEKSSGYGGESSRGVWHNGVYVLPPYPYPAPPNGPIGANSVPQPSGHLPAANGGFYGGPPVTGGVGAQTLPPGVLPSTTGRPGASFRPPPHLPSTAPSGQPNVQLSGTSSVPPNASYPMGNMPAGRASIGSVSSSNGANTAPANNDSMISPPPAYTSRLPDVPPNLTGGGVGGTSAGSGYSDDLDFDDLSARFEHLKRKGP